MALEAEFNTVLLTFGEGGDEVNAAMKAVKIRGGTTLDSVLQLFQEITADRERSGQIVDKKDIDTIECISRTKTERLKLQEDHVKLRSEWTVTQITHATVLASFPLGWSVLLIH